MCSTWPVSVLDRSNSDWLVERKKPLVLESAKTSTNAKLLSSCGRVFRKERRQGFV